MAEYIKREDVGLSDFEIVMCNGDYKEALKMLLEKVEKIPSADVMERKTGKWVSGKCDQCGEHAPYWCMASTYCMSNFCPYCGADMRGDDDV